MSNQKTFRDREILSAAHERGPISTMFSFLRLSGPGWLQSAITLGSGSLIGALYLGMLGGTSMLWLQLVAILIGVVMLSAISYVTLSTKKRPYRAINEHVNPVLGVAWLTATILANMIWIMPQFSLCYDALDKNLMVPGAFDVFEGTSNDDETSPTDENEADSESVGKTSEEATEDAAEDADDSDEPPSNVTSNSTAGDSITTSPVSLNLNTLNKRPRRSSLQEDDEEDLDDGDPGEVDEPDSDPEEPDSDSEQDEEEVATSTSPTRKIDFGKPGTKLSISALLGAMALVIVVMSFNPGWLAKTFDLVLKLIVGFIVICFVAVVYWLATDGSIDWAEVLTGFIPNFGNWNNPAPRIQEILIGLGGDQRTFWEQAIIEKQRESMIGVTATAVGLNMTFLLPYSMLARGWDKPFRGLARFDLITGMGIPYIIVTTCIVIASAHAFHGKADEKFLSDDPIEMQQSVLFKSTVPVIEKRFKSLKTPEEQTELNADIEDVKKRKAAALEANEGKLTSEQAKTFANELQAAEAAKRLALAKFAISLDDSSKEEKYQRCERRLIPTLVKPNAAQLASTLTPLLGEGKEKQANLIFGIGAFAMGFSTIIILSLINSYAFAEMFGKHDNNVIRIIGALLAIIIGIFWYELWAGESRTYLVILASTFGAILLPIAYLAFFLLMNSTSLLGNEKPTGGRMAVWNVLMGIGVAGATIQAIGAIQTKIGGTNGSYVLGGVAVFILLALVGFSARRDFNPDSEEELAN